MSWHLDAYKCWNMYVGSIHMWIEPRPSYCDRGHWIANVEGIPTIDEADFFPHYFMNLERAKLEMEEWLQWRLKREDDSKAACECYECKQKDKMI